MDNGTGTLDPLDVGPLDIVVEHHEVLEGMRAFHAEHLRREQGMVLLAVQWARLNPGSRRTLRDGSPSTSTLGLSAEDQLWQELADRGCPHVDTVMVPTFAEAGGLTEFQAIRLMREALLLVHLLPRVWKRASEGRVEVWRARKLAADCWELTPEAVDYVDRLMSLSTARHTEAGREAVIKEARLRYMAEAVEEELERANEQRHVEICTKDTGETGMATLSGVLDLPDAVDLEQAIRAGARVLKELGSQEPLTVRRSWALGDLARASQGGGALPLTTRTSRPGTPGTPTFLPDCACALGLRPPGRAAPPSDVMMYLHMSPESLDRCAPEEPATAHGTAREKPAADAKGRAVSNVGQGVVRVESTMLRGRLAISDEQVRAWFTRPRAAGGPRIVFRPVVDLDEHQHVEAYEVPERLKEQAGLTTGGCVFPWCTRPARSTDCDHILPWKQDGTGGPTCTCNLAPLCRRHHRAKTHADNHVGNAYTWWNYESLGEGQYLWRGPKGSVLLRTNAGVYDVTAEHVSAGPRHPQVSCESRSALDVTTEDPDLQARVAATHELVERIAGTFPEVVSDGRGADGRPLEFPAVLGPTPAPSWRQTAPEWNLDDRPEDFDDPFVGPGGIIRSLVEVHLREMVTEAELFSTPEQRRMWQFYREFARESGYSFPAASFTIINGALVHEVKEPFPARIDFAPDPHEER